VSGGAAARVRRPRVGASDSLLSVPAGVVELDASPGRSVWGFARRGLAALAAAFVVAVAVFGLFALAVFAAAVAAGTVFGGAGVAGAVFGGAGVAGTVSAGAGVADASTATVASGAGATGESSGGDATRASGSAGAAAFATVPLPAGGRAQPVRLAHTSHGAV
jgi:hypothetical protein